MEREALVPDRDSVAWGLRQTSVPHHKLAALRPDFLVISPPKTGSTWLAANLRCHSAIFVPEVKELKYFSSYFKWLDLNWYLDQFAAGAGRIKGEASPSYAILPVETIRLVRRLFPDVKLLFLMRDPVSRAWSHARHSYRYREANFAACAADLDAIADGQWLENFGQDWPLASGDYLGQLRRWLSVFPRERIHVGFYEAIAGRPQEMLREIFAFLGVTPDVDFARFRVRERILPGLAGELSPALRRVLQGLLHDRTRELACFLREQYGLELPPEWQASFAEPSAVGGGRASPASAMFGREFDDRYLAQVLAQEETFPQSPRPVLAGYRGYNLVFFRGQLYALADHLGRVCLDEIGDAELRAYQEDGCCFIAPSLAEVKECVDQHIFERLQRQGRAVETLHASLRDARQEIADLEQRLGRTVNEVQQMQEALQRVQGEMAQLTPWHVRAVRLVRKTWNRPRDDPAPGAQPTPLSEPRA